MNRDYFEILTMLAGGNANRMYDLFLMYKGYTKKDTGWKIFRTK